MSRSPEGFSPEEVAKFDNKSGFGKGTTEQILKGIEATIDADGNVTPFSQEEVDAVMSAEKGFFATIEREKKEAHEAAVTIEKKFVEFLNALKNANPDSISAKKEVRELQAALFTELFDTGRGWKTGDQNTFNAILKEWISGTEIPALRPLETEAFLDDGSNPLLLTIERIMNDSENKLAEYVRKELKAAGRSDSCATVQNPEGKEYCRGCKGTWPSSKPGSPNYGRRYNG